MSIELEAAVVTVVLTKGPTYVELQLPPSVEVAKGVFELQPGITITKGQRVRVTLIETNP